MGLRLNWIVMTPFLGVCGFACFLLRVYTLKRPSAPTGQREQDAQGEAAAGKAAGEAATGADADKIEHDQQKEEAEGDDSELAERRPSQKSSLEPEPVEAEADKSPARISREANIEQH